MRSEQLRVHMHKTKQGEFNSDLLTNSCNNKSSSKPDRNYTPTEFVTLSGGR